MGEEATVIRYGNCSIFSPPFDRTFALSYEQWALFPLSVQCTVALSIKIMFIPPSMYAQGVKGVSKDIKSHDKFESV